MFVGSQAQLHPSSRGAYQARARARVRVVTGPPLCGETQRPGRKWKRLFAALKHQPRRARARIPGLFPHSPSCAGRRSTPEDLPATKQKRAKKFR